MARKASITAWVVLSAFALAGQYIFRLFGITLPAFEIAGGVILLLIGLDMLNARRSPTQETGVEAEAAAEKEDAGIVPLGIPMLAGPGSITSVMVLVGQAQGRWTLVAVILAAILVTAVICYLVLGNSDRVANALGETGDSHPGADHGAAAGSAGGAVFRQWPGRSWRCGTARVGRTSRPRGLHRMV